MQHKLERQHVGNLETLNLARNYPGKVRTHALRRHFSRQESIGLLVGREKAQISLVPFVAGAGMSQLNQPLFHGYDSSTLTRIYSSMSARGARVGQMPSRPRGSIMPPAPPIKGGPLSASGGNRRPSFAASFLSAQRTAMRK